MMVIGKMENETALGRTVYLVMTGATKNNTQVVGRTTKDT